MKIYLPIIIHKDNLNDYDEIGRSGKNQINPSKKGVLAYRNTLCEYKRYKHLRSHVEKRFVQAMLLRYIHNHGGRILNKVPGDGMHYYVVSHHEALKKMAAKLRDGPYSTIIDDASIQSFSTDDMEIDNDFNISDIVF
jgi:hypothetical protein